MITKIDIKNFKGIYDLTFSTDGNAFIYGENGSGKSAFVDALYFIFKSARTIYDERRIYSLPSRIQGFYPELSSDDLKFRIRNESETLCDMLRSCHRIKSDEGPSFMLEFERNNVKGRYCISFGLDKMEKEALSINDAIAFSIDEDNVFLSSKFFFDEAYRRELKDRAQSSFGANTLMSFLYADIKGTSCNYYRSRISEELSEVIDFFSDVAIYSGEKKIGPMIFGCNNLVFGYSDSLNKTERDNIIKLLEFYRPYLLPSYSKFFYRTFIASGRELYELMLEKNGVTIPLSFESNGIKALFELFPYFISSLLGGVSILDDFDEKLSDGVLLQLLSELEKGCDGQTIATFRSYRNLSELDRKCVYKIDEINNENVIDLYDGRAEAKKKLVAANKKLLLEFRDNIR